MKLILSFLAILSLCLTPIFAAPTYSEVLPDSAPMVMVLNSPAKFLGKLSMEKHALLLQDLKRNSSREFFDMTDPAEYAKNGIDLNRPHGLGFLDEDMQTFAFFFAISDQEKFEVLFNRLLEGAPIEEFRAGEVDCMIIGSSESPEMILAFHKNYLWMFGTNYWGRGTLKAKVEAMLTAPKHLCDYKPFVECQEALPGNFFFYMDYGNLVGKALAREREYTPEEQRKVVDTVDNIIEQITSLGIDCEWNVEKLTVNAYVGIKPDSDILKAYKATQNCTDLLKTMRPNPLLCLNGNGDMQAAWAMNKEAMDVALAEMYLPGMKSLDELFGGVEQTIKQELGIELSIEKDIIKNIQGSSIIVLYELPPSDLFAVDLIIALRLNDAKALSELLDKVFVAGKQKYAEANKEGQDTEFPLMTAQVGNNNVYYLELAKAGPDFPNLTPTIGVFGSYFIISSKKALVEEIVEGKGNLLENIKDEELALGFTSGAPSVGFFKVAKLVEQVASLIPDERVQTMAMFFRHFNELSWTSKVGTNFVTATFKLQGDGDLLQQFLAEIEKVQEKQRQERERRMKEYEEMMRQYEEQRRKEQENSNKNPDGEDGEEENFEEENFEEEGE